MSINDDSSDDNSSDGAYSLNCLETNCKLPKRKSDEAHKNLSKGTSSHDDSTLLSPKEKVDQPKEKTSP